MMDAFNHFLWQITKIAFALMVCIVMVQAVFS